MSRAWIELDKDALEHNLRLYKALLPPACGIMGVVKANAYGHGALWVAAQLEALGVGRFAVATAEEGAALREGGIAGEILILGYTDPEDFPQLSAFDLTQTLTGTEHARALECFGRERGVRPRAQLAVDTGMHRIGFSPDETEELEHFFRSPWLRVTGLFSHLCAADSVSADDAGFTRGQIARFRQVVETLRLRGVAPEEIHLLGSYAAVNYPEDAWDFARLGILLFGVKSTPDGCLRTPLELRPVLTLKARITSVREIGIGESVGYGRAFRAERPTRVASVAIGYADGIPRCLGCGKLRAIAGGRFVTGIGRICMDQLMLDVTEAEDVHTGDTAIFIGRDGARVIDAGELAENAGTITNELLSCLSARLERRERLHVKSSGDT